MPELDTLGATIADLVSPYLDLNSGGGPPSGTAEGDLAGEYPGPQVVAVTHGGEQLVLGGVLDGQVVTRIGSSLVGVDPPGEPTGPAGGDLTNDFPNPSVVALTHDGERLDLGPISDGQFVGRVGSELRGVDPDPPLDGQIRSALESANGPSDLNPYATLNDIPGPETYPQPVRNIYIDPPAAPHAFDDEFNGGSPDLAERGWIIRNAATTLMTRLGDVLLGAGGFESTIPGGVLGPGSYRSSIIDGKLMIQVPDVTDIFIYRAVAGVPAIYALRGRMCLPRANQLFAACVVRNDPAITSFPGSGNRHAWTGYHHGGSAQTLRTNLGGDVYGNAQVTVSADSTADLHVLRLVGPAPTMGVRGLHIDSLHRMPQYVQRCYDNSYTMNAFAYAGIRLIGAYNGNNNNTTDTCTGLFVIDYIREMDVSLSPWFGEY